MYLILSTLPLNVKSIHRVYCANRTEIRLREEVNQAPTFGQSN